MIDTCVMTSNHRQFQPSISTPSLQRTNLMGAGGMGGGSKPTPAGVTSTGMGGMTNTSRRRHTTTTSISSSSDQAARLRSFLDLDKKASAITKKSRSAQLLGNELQHSRYNDSHHNNGGSTSNAKFGNAKFSAVPPGQQRNQLFAISASSAMTSSSLPGHGPLSPKSHAKASVAAAGGFPRTQSGTTPFASLSSSPSSFPRTPPLSPKNSSAALGAGHSSAMFPRTQSGTTPFASSSRRFGKSGSANFLSAYGSNSSLRGRGGMIPGGSTMSNNNLSSMGNEKFVPLRHAAQSSSRPRSHHHHHHHHHRHNSTNTGSNNSDKNTINHNSNSSSNNSSQNSSPGAGGGGMPTSRRRIASSPALLLKRSNKSWGSMRSMASSNESVGSISTNCSNLGGSSSGGRKNHNMVQMAQRSNGASVKAVIAELQRICAVAQQEQEQHEGGGLSGAVPSPLSSSLGPWAGGSHADSINLMIDEDDELLPPAEALQRQQQEQQEKYDKHPQQQEPPLQECLLLSQWAVDAYYKVLISKYQGITAVISAIVTFPTCPDLQAYGCRVLKHMDNLPTVYQSGDGMTAIQTAMRHHPVSIHVQSEACEALQRLAPYVIQLHQQQQQKDIIQEQLQQQMNAFIEQQVQQVQQQQQMNMVQQQMEDDFDLEDDDIYDDDDDDDDEDKNNDDAAAALEVTAILQQPESKEDPVVLSTTAKNITESPMAVVVDSSNDRSGVTATTTTTTKEDPVVQNTTTKNVTTSESPAVVVADTGDGRGGVTANTTTTTTTTTRGLSEVVDDFIPLLLHAKEMYLTQQGRDAAHFCLKIFLPFASSSTPRQCAKTATTTAPSSVIEKDRSEEEEEEEATSRRCRRPSPLNMEISTKR